MNLQPATDTADEEAISGGNAPTPGITQNLATYLTSRGIPGKYKPFSSSISLNCGIPFSDIACGYLVIFGRFRISLNYNMRHRLYR